MSGPPATLTRSQTVAAEVTALLRARTPLLWIVTREAPRSIMFGRSTHTAFADGEREIVTRDLLVAARNVRRVLANIEKALVSGRVRAVVGAQGAIAFAGLTEAERDGRHRRLCVSPDNGDGLRVGEAGDRPSRGAGRAQRRSARPSGRRT